NRLGLRNLDFPGGRLPGALADEFRSSSFFVLPSYAEGVPKVTQEAAACGLPIVLHGFYEAPTVIHKLNGFGAWSDEEMIEQVGSFIRDPDRCRQMGLHGAAMAKE